MIRRRHLLGGLAASVALAGCTGSLSGGSGSSTGSGSASSTADPCPNTDAAQVLLVRPTFHEAIVAGDVSAADLRDQFDSPVQTHSRSDGTLITHHGGASRDAFEAGLDAAGVTVEEIHSYRVEDAIQRTTTALLARVEAHPGLTDETWVEGVQSATDPHVAVHLETDDVDPATLTVVHAFELVVDIRGDRQVVARGTNITDVGAGSRRNGRWIIPIVLDGEAQQRFAEALSSDGAEPESKETLVHARVAGTTVLSAPLSSNLFASIVAGDWTGRFVVPFGSKAAAVPLRVAAGDGQFETPVVSETYDC